LEQQAGIFNSGGDDGDIYSFEPGATSRLQKGKYWNGIAPTIRSDPGDNSVSVAIPIDMRNAVRNSANGDDCGLGIGEDGEPSFTVTAEHIHALAINQHPADSRIKIDDTGCINTLTSRCGTGGNNVPMCAEPVIYGIASVSSNSMRSSNPYSGVYETDSAKTLDTSSQTPKNQGGLVICMEGNGQRPSHKGSGVGEGVAFTLNTCEKHNVAYAMTTGSYTQVCEDAAPTLQARDFKDPPIVNEPAFGIDRAAYNQSPKALYKPQIDIESIHSLTARGPGAVSAPPAYIVRRLTPRECLMLMNLPHDSPASAGSHTPFHARSEGSLTFSFA
jgi:DNA (cytosine-5)-methyltransferase 1